MPRDGFNNGTNGMNGSNRHSSFGDSTGNSLLQHEVSSSGGRGVTTTSAPNYLNSQIEVGGSNYPVPVSSDNSNVPVASAAQIHDSGTNNPKAIADRTSEPPANQEGNSNGYQAKRNDGKSGRRNKNDDSGNKSSGGNKSSATDKAKDAVKNKAKDAAVNAATAIPYVGQAIKALQVANKLKQSLQKGANGKDGNSPLGNLNPMAKGGVPSLLGGNKKESDEGGSSDSSNSSSGGLGIDPEKIAGMITGAMALKIKIYASIAVAAIFIIMFLVLSGNEMSAQDINFASSTIAEEELIAGDMEFDENSTLSQEEQNYIKNLKNEYESHKDFNPNLLSSVFQVMMLNQQYGEAGSFNFADVNSGCESNNGFVRWWNGLWGNQCKIAELAGILKGSQDESGNVVGNGNSYMTIDGVAAVASDAGTAIGNVGNLGRDYVPPVIDTGRPSLSGNCQLLPDTWAAFQVMEQAAARDGVTIGVNSCYRSYDKQAVTTGNSPAAAGYSEHQLGSTIDIANHDSGIIDTPEVNNWLYAHAEEYGFINRHFNMSNETHHFRFIGSQMAQAYAKYKDSTSGRPHYSISYDEFVKTPEAQELIRTGGNNASNNSSSGATSSKNYSSVVLVGDSRFEGQQEYNLTNEKTTYIAKSSQGLAYLKQQTGAMKAKDSANTAFVINLGVNDIYNVDNYISYINSIKSSFQGDIYYLSVNPVEEAKEAELYKVTNAEIDNFNAKMKSGLQGVKYLDSNSYLKSQGYSTVDGVHYNKDTSTKIFNFIQSKTSASSSSNSSATSNNSANTANNAANASTGANTGGSADAIISIAEKEIGTGEQNNTTKYGIWYGLPDGEWCAMFVSWCANQAGVTEDVIPKYALVSDGRNFFKDRGLYHPVSDSGYTPKKGDVIFYSHGHTGLVKDYQNGQIVTIEGNTGSYTTPVVKEKTFNPLATDVDGYGSPQYTNTGTMASSNNGDGSFVNKDEQYRQKIKEFLKKYLPKASDTKLDLLVNDIFEYKNDYYELIGKKFINCDSTATASGGSCIYDIKGFNLQGKTVDQPMQISNLKVRLMNCVDKGRGQPVEGEELVDFEKYILGVTYAEVGDGFPGEGAKAEAIAARSYALSRPTIMGNSMGTALIQENDQWILQMRSCTEDQVYCDPDRGCSRDDGSSGSTHYSGTDHAVTYKPPLPADDPMRAQVAETNGKLLLDNQGYVVNADYFDTDQQAWGRMANSGLLVDQILVQHYGQYGASKLSDSNCSGAGSTVTSTSSASTNPECKGVNNNGNAGQAATGDYVNWKQHDPRWAGVSLGSSDMGHIGCTITAIAMLVARSGLPTGNITDFNPGTFAEALKAAGVTHGDGNTDVAGISKVIPGFEYVGKMEFDIKDNSSPEGNAIKVAKAKELLDQGYYVIVSGSAMYSGGGHWEAIDRVENGIIYMLDPYHDNGDLLASYRSTWAFHWYKANK